MTTATLKSVESINDNPMEEAVKLANEIERMESALKQMKDDLKKCVDQYGPVDTGEKVWNYYDSESWSFNEEGLKQIAQGMAMEGMNPWELLKLPTPSIKKLGWEDHVIEQFGKKKVSKRFSSKKK